VSTFIPVNPNVFNNSRLWVSQLLHRLAWQAAAGFCLFVVGALGVTRLFAGSEPGLTALTPTAAKNAVLEVRANHAAREYGYVTVTGEAANLSDRAVKNVEAVVEFFDRDRKLLKVETALLSLPTALPGEETPFTVQTRDLPGMSAYRVRFRHLLGETIPSR
jgi:hypothetical protein